MDIFTIQQAVLAVNGRLFHKCNTPLSEIVIDNRLVKEGCLFVAIIGDRFDGHDFISDAFAAGAAAVISQKELETDKPYILVEDTRQALLDLARFNRERFSGSVVGITGSVGKTTTKEMIASILSETFETIKTEGNLNNAIGLPRTLFRLDSSCNAAVIEMGMSGMGEISVLSKTAQPMVGVITNIGTSHIEQLGSRENILHAKLEILHGMKQGTPLVVNADNDLLSGVLKQEYQSVVKGHPVIRCSFQDETADVFGTNLTTNEQTIAFDVIAERKITHINLPILGVHNAQNALLAFAVGRLHHIQEDKIAKALSAYQPVGLRQKIECMQGVTVIADCYNASPESMEASILTLKNMTGSGRKIAVLGDMLELGFHAEREHRRIGRFLTEQGIDALFCVGKNVEFLAEEAACKTNAYYANKDELAAALRRFMREGDIILFKASRGMKLETIIEKVFDKKM